MHDTFVIMLYCRPSLIPQHFHHSTHHTALPLPSLIIQHFHSHHSSHSTSTPITHHTSFPSQHSSYGTSFIALLRYLTHLSITRQHHHPSPHLYGTSRRHFNSVTLLYHIDYVALLYHSNYVGMSHTQRHFNSVTLLVPYKLRGHVTHPSCDSTTCSTVFSNDSAHNTFTPKALFAHHRVVVALPHTPEALSTHPSNDMTITCCCGPSTKRVMSTGACTLYI